MSNAILYMSMSLDGFIAGPDDSAEQGLGADGECLHSWLGEWKGKGDSPGFEPPGASGEVFEETMSSGAVVVGRKTFDYAGQWDGNHHDVPIYVPTRGEPPEQPISDWVHYTRDVESAVSQAKEAAGEKNVMVHGADLAQSALKAGVLDELQIHLVPVLLGAGRPLFAHLGTDHVDLQLTSLTEGPGVVHLRYRVAS